MEIIFSILFFLFGTIIGSFLNVVILRFNTGAGLNGRSRCFSCGKDIKWYDLVPVFSYIFLMGKCRHCKSKISAQYPAVELLTGLIFVSAFNKFLPEIVFSNNLSVFYSIFFIDLLVLANLVVITVYDLKHKIIPDTFAIIFSVAALIKIFILIPVSDLLNFPNFVFLLAGPILALPFYLLWLISNGKWIGLGDAKLALGIGWYFGLAFGLSAVVIGFWVGAVVSVLLMVLNRIGGMRFSKPFVKFFGIRNLTLKSEVPFAPFLIAGFLAVYFFGFDVFGLSLLGI